MIKMEQQSFNFHYHLSCFQRKLAYDKCKYRCLLLLLLVPNKCLINNGCQGLLNRDLGGC